MGMLNNRSLIGWAYRIHAYRIHAVVLNIRSLIGQAHHYAVPTLFALVKVKDLTKNKKKIFENDFNLCLAFFIFTRFIKTKSKCYVNMKHVSFSQQCVAISCTQMMYPNCMSDQSSSQPSFLLLFDFPLVYFHKEHYSSTECRRLNKAYQIHPAMLNIPSICSASSIVVCSEIRIA